MTLDQRTKSLLVRSIVSAIALLGFVSNLSFRHGEEFSRDELILLAVAVTPWLSEFVSSFKIGADGVEVITKRLDDVEKKADAAFVAGVHGVAKNPKFETKTGDEDCESRGPSITGDDRNKGQYGGKARANGRKLLAQVEKIPDEDFYRRVVLSVMSTDKSKPLKDGDKVTFHLHPTFNPPVFDQVAKNGVAETTLISYGAFTVGVEADNGATRLEFDLQALDDGDDFFDR